MGKIYQGITGAVSGKVGNLIGSTWKGIPYVRIQPASVANPRTVGQVNQRSRLKSMLEILQSAKDLVAKGFKMSAVKQSAFNAAMSYNLKSAFSGSPAIITPAYEAISFARGNLQKLEGVTCESAAANSVTASWDASDGIGNQSPDDVILMIVYNETLKKSFTDSNVAIREESTVTREMPASWSGDDCHVYLFCQNILTGEVSDSVYAGAVTLI